MPLEGTRHTLMRIDLIVLRWLEVLAGLYFACRETWRVRRALIVTREGEHFVVRKAEPQRDAIIQANASDRNAVLAMVAVGHKVPARVMRAARNGFVILELSPGEVAVRRLNIPAPAREFLPGIVRNQIERLSPWHIDDVAYGFEATPHAEDAANLDVRVSLVSRRVIDAARNGVAATGLDVDRIVTRPQESTSARPVMLWSKLAEGTREETARTGRRIGIGLAAIVVISVAVSAWAVTSKQSIEAESEVVEGRFKALQRQMAELRSPQALASLSPQQRIWHAKEGSPAAVLMLEALSRALPDAAYLTEFRLENAMLRMTGVTKDAPSLIAPLEQSGQLADVRFSAPTTRESGGASFRFHIEARVQPPPTPAEKQP
jgi:general secretion pathway protein L